MTDSIFCAFCEDHHYHEHRADDGRPIVVGSSPEDRGLGKAGAMAMGAFREYDVFRLVKPICGDDSVPLGSRGVVLMILGGNPIEYEVEFPDGTGGNLGTSTTYTIKETQMAAEPDGNRPRRL